MVCLVRIAYDTGYINEDLAWNYICSAGQQCMQAFSNWTEVGKSFLLGQAMEASEKENRKEILASTEKRQKMKKAHGKKNTEIKKLFISINDIIHICNQGSLYCRIREYTQ